MVKNFVSVSAVSNKEQLAEINRVCKAERLQFPLAIGYQVSHKSINQGTQNPRQPKFANLGELDKETRGYGLITAVHYYTKDNSTIIGDLERIIEIGVNPKLALLQFNTLPPSTEVLRTVKDMAFGVIFKVAVSDKQTPQGGYAVWKGKDVQDVSSGEITPLVKQVYDRRVFIDYAMFDPSHGTNLDLDLNENSLAIRFGKEVTALDGLNHLGLAYAGGIKPNNAQKITKALNSFFPNRVSIDIESGVRIDDKLDLRLVREYLVNYQRAIQNG